MRILAVLILVFSSTAFANRPGDTPDPWWEASHAETSLPILARGWRIGAFQNLTARVH
jgi:hypothetical protein